jgi:hypothetical protein
MSESYGKRSAIRAGHEINALAPGISPSLLTHPAPVRHAAQNRGKHTPIARGDSGRK